METVEWIGHAALQIRTCTVYRENVVGVRFCGEKFRELLKAHLTTPTYNTRVRGENFCERPPFREIREIISHENLVVYIAARPPRDIKIAVHEEAKDLSLFPST